MDDPHDLSDTVSLCCHHSRAATQEEGTLAGFGRRSTRRVNFRLCRSSLLGACRSATWRKSTVLVLLVTPFLTSCVVLLSALRTTHKSYFLSAYQCLARCVTTIHVVSMLIRTACTPQKLTQCKHTSRAPGA